MITIFLLFLVAGGGELRCQLQTLPRTKV